MHQESDIKFFKKDYEFLSNFYPCNPYIKYGALNYATIEHAFQAAKTNDYGIKQSISLLPANKAGYSKRIGRKIKLINNWDLRKLTVMRELVTIKFSIPELQKLLLLTNDRILIEGNYWHDNYWGDCSCSKCSSIKGQNHLGKILMKVRNLYVYKNIDSRRCP